jgi:hypothetical protein
MVNKDSIIRVYSGRNGCACGCRGTYRDSKSSITRVYNKLMANPDLIEEGNGYTAMVLNDRLYIAYTE